MERPSRRLSSGYAWPGDRGPRRSARARYGTRPRSQFLCERTRTRSSTPSTPSTGRRYPARRGIDTKTRRESPKPYDAGCVHRDRTVRRTELTTRPPATTGWTPPRTRSATHAFRVVRIGSKPPHHLCAGAPESHFEGPGDEFSEYGDVGSKLRPTSPPPRGLWTAAKKFLRPLETSECDREFRGFGGPRRRSGRTAAADIPDTCRGQAASVLSR